MNQSGRGGVPSAPSVVSKNNMKKKSLIFGPVPSRRLGFSLGVDVVPFKTCSLDCVYCQLGCTTDKTLARKRYFRTEEVAAELRAVLPRKERVDWITFSGSGEPTLNAQLGEIIDRVKEFTDIPVAVLTNGTLLHEPAVREALRAASLIVPSLDAGTEPVFRKVNRPHPGLTLEKVVGGIAGFTAEFPGRVWLEVMLVKGINDSEAELGAIARRINKITPGKIQLNTVARPPAEKEARALNPEEMEKARAILEAQLYGAPVEVVGDFGGEEGRKKRGEVKRSVVEYLKRRPGTLEDLSVSLGFHRDVLIGYLHALLESGEVREEYRGSEKYFIYN